MTERADALSGPGGDCTLAMVIAHSGMVKMHLTRLERFELYRQESVGRRAFSVSLLNGTSAFDSRILHQKVQSAREEVEDNIWFSTKHGDSSNKGEQLCSWWCAACGGQYNWKDPKGVLVVQDSVNPSEAKVFRAHASTAGHVANPQTGADNLMETIFDGLQEQSRLKIMHEPRRFIEVDNHTAVKIGDLEKNSEAIKTVKPEFNKEIYQNAAVRERMDEFRLLDGEAGTFFFFFLKKSF